MEYIEGTPIKGPMPFDQALRYAIEICEALDAAHRKFIIHRDLKPANIMVNKAGVKVLDFGLAKLKPKVKHDGATLAPTVTMGPTQEGAILGTLQYMSPEQAEGQEADARSDIFSFGAVLYEMLTGRKAFEGKSAASILASVMKGEPAAMPGLLHGRPHGCGGRAVRAPAISERRPLPGRGSGAARGRGGAQSRFSDRLCPAHGRARRSGKPLPPSGDDRAAPQGGGPGAVEPDSPSAVVGPVRPPRRPPARSARGSIGASCTRSPRQWTLTGRRVLPAKWAR